MATKLKIEDRVERYNIKDCFITLKDHKNSFKVNPECRLINPAKTQIGKISKNILEDICATLRIALNINQWRSTYDCIKWYKEYGDKKGCTFIKYDIKEFYPSITEDTLDKAIELAKEYIAISDEKIKIIKHCRKTVLSFNDNLWIKKGEKGALTHGWI